MRNQVRLIGNLGMTPEIKNFDGGKTMAKFSLATNESYKNANGERVQETQWHNVVAWGKTAELAAQLLKKGSEVAIEGKLLNRSYEDQKGVKHYVTEIQLNEFVIFGQAKK
jgi:single-strand DNA-binding protein